MTKKKKRDATGGDEREGAGAAAGATPGGAAAEPDAPQDLYSLRQLAGLLKVDRNRLAERVRDLESFQGAHGSRLYSLSAVEQVLAEDPDPDIREARLRKLVAEAGLAELRLKRERGELVDYRDLLADQMEMFRHFHLRFTVTVPQRLGPRLAVAQKASEAEEILRVELAREFQEFRTELVQHQEHWDEAAGLEAEEANDDER